MTEHRESLDITTIHPDLDNPRIADWLMENPNPNKHEVLIMLGENEPTKSSESKTTWHSLKKSIENFGGLINPIIVSQSKEGVYKVIEGNTRLAIFLSLYEETKDSKWKKIPAIIYKELTFNAEHSIKLQAHLVGIRPWSPFAKGKYLFELERDGKLNTQEIIDICGGKKKDIINYIDAYKDMLNHFIPQHEHPQDMETNVFSAFVEIQSPKRRQALQDHGFTMDDFAEWNKPPHKRMIKNEHVRSLVKILNDPVAKEKFINESSLEAKSYLDSKDNTFKDVPTHQLADELSKRVRSDYEELLEQIENGSSSTDALHELFGELQMIFERDD